MKKFLFLIVVAALMSLPACMPQKPNSFVVYTDFVSITAEYGVGLTESNSVSWDYQSLGTIFVRVVDGDEKYEEEVYDPTYGKFTETRKRKVKASQGAAVTMLAQRAKEAGADYVINITAVPEYDSKSNTWYWLAKGMAVKRR